MADTYYQSIQEYRFVKLNIVKNQQQPKPYNIKVGLTTFRTVTLCYIVYMSTIHVLTSTHHSYYEGTFYSSHVLQFMFTTVQLFTVRHRYTEAKSLLTPTGK